MISLNDIILQIFQPYFFYSLVFLSIAFISIKIFLKFNPHLSRRCQSILWTLPLFVPVSVLLCFPPQSNIAPTIHSQFSNSSIGVLFLGSNILSFTGLLCISGVIAATGYLVLVLFFGKKIALKRFHVVMLAQNEHVLLQQEVKETSHKLGIAVPKVGLVDDLMPNAFTLGYGRNTMVVFSLGLLKMLDHEELAAVASHELAHIKAKDYLFRTVSYALNALSFFNPLAYFAASQAQKERELLADEKSVALLDKPMLMQNVLTKLEATLPHFPRLSLAERFSSSLFIVSPLAHRSGILATHPQISQRVQNINAVASKQTKKTMTLLPTIFLLSILVCVTFVAVYSTVQIEQTIIQNQNDRLMNQYKILMYNTTVTSTSNPQMGILFTNAESYLNFSSGQEDFFIIDSYS